MQTRLMFALCTANILINTAVISGCVYEKQQYKTTKQQINGTIHRQKEQLIEPKEQLQNNKEIKVEIKTDKDGDIQVAKPASLGEFKLTAYCPCEICCGKWANNRPDGIVYGAIGEELKEGYSIAVDPNVIPYRAEVIINGKAYKAQDCGGAIKGNRIDVYMKNHNDALEFGVQYAEVFVKL